MEAKGLFEAVDFATEQAPTLVVRGISDYADPGKEKTDRKTGGVYRRASTRAAALFVAGLIDRRMQYPDESQPTTEPLRLSDRTDT